MIGRLIARAADAFSTRTAIVAALVWSLLPFAFPQWQTVILYVSAGVVQLVALPLLAWQGRRGLEKTDAIVESHARIHASLDALHRHLGTGHGQAPPQA